MGPLGILFSDPVRFFELIALFLSVITIHEYAHAWAADRLGDPTARLLGRKSLDPRRHIDPLGAILFLFTWFGWAKPVPVDTFNLRDGEKDNALIALAGPAINLAAAIVAALVYRALLFTPVGGAASSLLVDFASLNVYLAIFNLLPIPPLDGSRIYRAVLPSSLYPFWSFLDRYGMYILLFIFLSGINLFGNLLTPISTKLLLILFP